MGGAGEQEDLEREEREEGGSHHCLFPRPSPTPEEMLKWVKPASLPRPKGSGT